MPTFDVDVHNEAAACMVEARERSKKRGRLLMRTGRHVDSSGQKGACGARGSVNR